MLPPVVTLGKEVEVFYCYRHRDLLFQEQLSITTTTWERRSRSVFYGRRHRDLLFSVATDTGIFCFLWPQTQGFSVFCGHRHRDLLFSMATDTGIFCFLWPQTQGSSVFYGHRHMEQLSITTRREGSRDFLLPQTQGSSVPGAALYNNNQTGNKWRFSVVISGRTWIFLSGSSSLHREPDGKEVEVFYRHRHGDLLFQEQLSTTTTRREISGGFLW